MTLHSTWAVVPVKRFALAKQRLATCLATVEREELSRAMLDDVLHAASVSSGIDGVLVVSNEPDLGNLQQCHGFELLREPPASGGGLNSALRHAVTTLASRGVGNCCILHADLPLARPEAIENLLDVHRQMAARPAVTLVPDRANDGTNAMLCSPPAALDFVFGGGSFALHRELATRNGVDVRVVRADGLALDIDTVHDLRALRHRYRLAGELANSTTEALLNVLACRSAYLPDAQLPRRTA